MTVTPHIHIINGPNLDRLGKREPEIYGTATLADIANACERRSKAHGMAITFRQSSHEGTLIEFVHEAADTNARAIIINPAGLSFTSMALMDAMKTFPGLKFEVHLSNIHAREAIYHHSLISKVVRGVIAGFGTHGYLLAIDAVAHFAGLGGN